MKIPTKFYVFIQILYFSPNYHHNSIDKDKKVFYNYSIRNFYKQNEKRKVKNMKSTGIVRKIDGLGRLVLPIELRRTFNIDENDAVEIYTDDDMIILKKFQRSCLFCGESDNLVDYKGKNVCASCLEELNKRKD